MWALKDVSPLFTQSHQQFRGRSLKKNFSFFPSRRKTAQSYMRLGWQQRVARRHERLFGPRRSCDVELHAHARWAEIETVLLVVGHMPNFSPKDCTLLEHPPKRFYFSSSKTLSLNFFFQDKLFLNGFCLSIFFPFLQINYFYFGGRITFLCLNIGQ